MLLLERALALLGLIDSCEKRSFGKASAKEKSVPAGRFFRFKAFIGVLRRVRGEVAPGPVVARSCSKERFSIAPISGRWGLLETALLLKGLLVLLIALVSSPIWICMETSDSCRDDEPVGRICFRELLPAPGDLLFGSQRVSHLVNAAVSTSTQKRWAGMRRLHTLFAETRSTTVSPARRTRPCPARLQGTLEGFA